MLIASNSPRRIHLSTFPGSTARILATWGGLINLEAVCNFALTEPNRRAYGAGFTMAMLFGRVPRWADRVGRRSDSPRHRFRNYFRKRSSCRSSGGRRFFTGAEPSVFFIGRHSGELPSLLLATKHRAVSDQVLKEPARPKKVKDGQRIAVAHCRPPGGPDFVLALFRVSNKLERSGFFHQLTALGLCQREPRGIPRRL
jgi:hypothetical protein